MKKFAIILTGLFILSSSLRAQDFKSPLDHTDSLRYKKDEILIKFKDDVTIHLQKVDGYIQTNNKAIDASFKKNKIQEMEKLFPLTEKMEKPREITFPDGTSKHIPQLFNIYLLKTTGTIDVKSIIRELEMLPEVEYAEVNGEAYINEFVPVSDILQESDLPAYSGNNSRYTIPTPNDPLYPDQWYIPYVKADSLWETTTGDSTEVISILDTGVDYLHPDLANKIWTNHNEIPDNGIDDDNNGYIDDTRGWDFVNQDNDPKDDNSHGTHCAGIAAAETDNGIGIAGVSWGAKIMPIKVFQSNGIGYFSHIAQGFWYAAENGSTIFSNSWSSEGESLTIRNAMEYAYAFGLIVAAAGNSGYKIDYPVPPWPPTVPNFPACYNWVLGVEATDQSGNNTWFSNFDPTGPVISDGRPYGSIYYNDKDFNYEMRAPGFSFISTVPNGQYRSYSGTSMACPLVAGSIALMKSYDPTLSNEMVFAKLIQPIKLGLMQAGVLDILTCTFTDPPTDLYFKSYSISDSLYGGDNDGRPDAGELIDMYVTVKNAGGLGDSIFAKLRFSEFEDTTTAQILDSTCYLGSISTYATKTSSDPIQIRIDSNVVNARIISFELLIWSEDNLNDTIIKGITLTIEHGVEIKGTYEKLHLSGDAYYLVTEVAAIDTLIIDPGVTLRFSNNLYILIFKYLYAVGTPDSMITFKGAEGSFVHSISMADGVYSNFTYCIFQDGTPSWNFYLVNPTKIHHSIFKYNLSKALFQPIYGGDYQYNMIYENSYQCSITEEALIRVWNLAAFKYNILANNYSGSGTATFMFYNPPYPQCMDSIINNVFVNNDPYSCGTSNWNGWPQGLYKLKQNYWGTTNNSSIKSQILDFYENSNLSVLEPDTILIAPPPECHGVVWKVELNGQNPQNGQLEPIGPGPLKFDVYFNRAMDPDFVPFVTFGVRYPYVQNIVCDSMAWSADSTVWTAYSNIDMSSGDGENTVRVAFARDTDHFEIPVERSRFHFVIQAAGSQSVAFMATPGIGKVDLEWPLLDSLDVLGYNLYRYKMPTDSTCSDTTLLNTGPIIDSVYTDYNVLPDTTYYYMFTVVKTDFTESDYSKVMAATPFAAANGDANGDMIVNVLDITTIVAYMLNQNPTPFLFDAADVNYDGDINVLDIIGVVQLISGNNSVPLTAFVDVSKKTAFYDIADNTLSLESEGNVAAIQFKVQSSRFKAERSEVRLRWIQDFNSQLATCNLQQLEKLKIFSLQKGFEFAYGIVDDHIIGILFSLTGNEIPEGNQELFRFEGIDICEIEVTEIFGGDLNGDYVPVLKKGQQSSIKLPEGYELTAQPNPFTNSTVISWQLAEEALVDISIYDLKGRKIKQIKNSYQQAGFHQAIWDGRNETGNQLAPGIYICHMEASPLNNSMEKVNRDIKLIINR